MDELTSRVQILSDPDTIAELDAELSGENGIVSVQPSPVPGPIELEFALETVAAILAIVQVVFLEESLANTLLRVFRRKKTKHVTLNGEFGRVTLDLAEGTTEDDVLRALSGVTRPD